LQTAREHAQLLARTVAGSALAVGLIVACGWIAGVPVLTSVLPGGSRMVPATAALFVLSGGSLYLLLESRRLPAASAGPLIAGLLALIILGTGVVRILMHLTRSETSLDFLGLSTHDFVGDGPIPSMAPATCVSFILVGGALLSSRERSGRIYQTLAISIVLLGWIGMSRYVYGGATFAPYAQMSLPTAMLFMALGVGLLALRADIGLAALIRSEGAAGASLRRLLPAAIVLPLAFGWLHLHSQSVGWLGPGAAVSVFGLMLVGVFAALIWANALELRRAEVQRRDVQEALRASQERTRLIVDNALDAVVTMDAHGVITGWSPRAESMFGWPRAEAVGRLLCETIVPQRFREAHTRGLHRYLESGETRVLNTVVELSALHRAGHEFSVELAITPLRMRQELQFSAFVRDITARLEGQAKLRESQQRFRILAESLPQLVWTCRPDGWCDYLSKQWVEYTGRPESEQVGYGWAEHLHPEDRELARREWAAATERGDSFDVEFRIRRHDGVYRWFKTRAVPLTDAEGRIVKWFGSNTDFDELRCSQTRLRMQLERLHLLDRITRAMGERQDLRSIFQAIIRSLESDLPIDFGCVLLGTAADATLAVACVGSRSEPLAAAADLAEQVRIAVDENGLARCVRGQLVYEPDIRAAAFEFPTRLARAGLASLVAAPLAVERTVFGVLIAARREANGFDSGTCEFIRQLSEHAALAAHQAKLHGDLQRAYDDLRDSQRSVMQQERLRAIGQMASGIAHDINNALSPATLYAQSLLERDKSLSDGARESLLVIQRAIDDVAHTVARMRDFYRPRDPQSAHFPLTINEVLAHVVDLTRARWRDMPQERGIVIELQTDFEAGLPEVAGDESEIRDALTNLVLNAVDAMPEGGTLSLQTSLRGGSVCISVSDTGIGMNEETRSRCLEPFFTTKGERGTGLGLPMVFGAVKRHNGEMLIESELGKGTRVQILLPVATAETSRMPPSEHARVTQSLRLLLIDDDPMLLKALQDALSQDGHDIVTADSGQAGIECFRADGNFSAVITDLGMPYVDGRSVAAAIKAAAANVPVILLTGWGQRMLAEEDIPPYVDRILSKPPSLVQLRSVLAELTLESERENHE
jgi:PAS domain S-box-containing protein